MKYLLYMLLFTMWLCTLHYRVHHAFITEKKAVTLTGTISTIPINQAHGQSFTFNSTMGRLKLAWYHHDQNVQLGQRWQLHLKLKPPHGYHNPGGIEFEKWLLAQHIVAVGYVENKGANVKLADSHSLRARLLQRMTQRYADNPYLDIVLALSLGANQLLTPEHRALFQTTSTSHLMAISGLHVGLVATMVFALSAWCMQCYPRLLRFVPKQKIATCCALLAALIYSVLAGFSLSTERAMIMLTVSLLSYYFFCKQSLSKSLTIAFVVMLMLDPLAIYAAGFWLSFCAVFVLVFSMSARLGEPPWYLTWGRAQFVCSFALIPLTAWYFQGFSALSMIANLVAIPVVSFVVVPCSLLAILTIKLSAISQLFFSVATCILKYLLVFLAQLTSGYCYFALHNVLEMSAALLCVLVLLLPIGLRVKHLAPIFLLPVFFPIKHAILPGHFSLTVLDVGQGLACVLQTAAHTVVFDTGPKFDRFDAGGNIVVPYLKFRGVKKIDTIVVSHGDNDHVGGLDAIVKSFPGANIYTSDQRAISHPTILCDKSIHWQMDQVQFSFLNDKTAHYKKDNNNSCVLKVTGASGSVLFTGDIEKQAEKKLLTHGLASTVMVVPHHGSRTSSTQAFIKAVHAKYAIFSYGFLNRFHHPSEQVVQRYLASGATVFNTVASGAVTLEQ